ncbi:hypothetical protein, partial [Phascolarctobacterium succinatutens]|uniref:hypothetical protein n=1 Tax=Phascolarctobacterium succinatutens TaxID=626940 RepID=UPI0026ED07BA
MSTINIRLTQIFSAQTVLSYSKAFLWQSVLKIKTGHKLTGLVFCITMPEKLFLFYFGNNASANGTAA